MAAETGSLRGRLGWGWGVVAGGWGLGMVGLGVGGSGWWGGWGLGMVGVEGLEVDICVPFLPGAAPTTSVRAGADPQSTAIARCDGDGGGPERRLAVMTVIIFHYFLGQHKYIHHSSIHIHESALIFDLS